MSDVSGRIPLVVIGGPTASGKSALALTVAEEFGGTVINADSMQVYRELTVLTARPGSADLARAPHRLYGMMSVTERCSAVRWRELAVAEIVASHRVRRLPIVVGGTGLYIKALLDGLSPIPDVPAAVRAMAQARLAELGTAGFHEELRRRDPLMAARLAAGDRQRMVRAWEVLEATGRSLADWQGATPAAAADEPRLTPLRFVLDPPRAALYAACNRRLTGMLTAGALDEVTALAGLALPADQPAMKALGVPELLAHVRGETDLATATAAAQQATRRYAKRQTTWFRHQLPGAERLEPEGVAAQFLERLRPKIFANIRHLILTPQN